MNINEMKKEMALLIEATDNVVEKELNGKLKKVAGNLGQKPSERHKHVYNDGKWAHKIFNMFFKEFPKEETDGLEEIIRKAIASALSIGGQPPLETSPRDDHHSLNGNFVRKHSDGKFSVTNTNAAAGEGYNPGGGFETSSHPNVLPSGIILNITVVPYRENDSLYSEYVQRRLAFFQSQSINVKAPVIVFTQSIVPRVYVFDRNGLVATF